MQKSEMAIGELHAVEFPAGEAHTSRYSASPVVKATVLAVGLERRSRYSSDKARNDGVRCRLEAPIRTIEGTNGCPGAFMAREPGFEFEVQSRDVLRPWGAFTGCVNDDDAMQAQREARYAVQDELRAIFERLGAPKVELAGGGAVFAAADLLRWLKRIDPVDVAEQAIGLFMEEVARHGDGLTGGVEALAKGSAISEITQGVAVTDVEIGAGGEG